MSVVTCAKQARAAMKRPFLLPNSAYVSGILTITTTKLPTVYRLPVTRQLFDSNLLTLSLDVKEIGCLSYDNACQLHLDSKQALKVLRDDVVAGGVYDGQPVYFERRSDASREIISTSGRSRYLGLLKWLHKHRNEEW